MIKLLRDSTVKTLFYQTKIKTDMRKKNLILVTILGLLAISINIQAQIDEDVMFNQSVPGYIITEEGDTIKGRVKVNTRAKNQVKVRFSPPEGRSKKYTPKDILGYGYQTVENSHSAYRVPRWRHFLRRTSDQPPIPFSSTNVFMEVKASGKAMLYSFYKQNNAEVSSKYQHYYFLEFKDGTRERKITQDDFDWAVPAFLEDCPRITNLVGSSLGYADLEEVVDIYNNCSEYQIQAPDCDCDAETTTKGDGADAGSLENKPANQDLPLPLSKNESSQGKDQ